MATGSFRKEDSWMSSPAFHWERCRLGREEISLPESWLDEEVFDNVLNLNTWYNVLTDDHRKHLKKFLPKFPDNDAEEKEKTIRDLFSGKDFKFENPLHKFHWKFQGGWFSPDIVTYAALLKKAKHRDYMYQQRRYYAKLVQQILVSRKHLLGDLCKIPPDQPMKRPVIPSFDLEKTTSLEQRANQRYYKILQEVRADCGFDESSSSDENFSVRSRKKQKKQPNLNDGDDSSEELRVFSTFAPKPVVNGIENGEIKKRTSTRNPFETREHSYKRMLKRYKRRKAENKDAPEFDFGNITLQDIISRANINKLLPCKGENTNSPAKKKFKDKHEKKKKHKPMPDLNCSPSQSEFASILSQDIVIKEEPLDEEDVISAKEAVALSTGSNSPKNVKCSSFFSLLRDFICESSDQKIHVAKLEEKVKAWQESPDTSNFDWFSAHPNWSELVLLALKFLAGDLVGIQPDEFVPYLDYKEKQQQWQWLGLGRDSDQDLLPLYKHWLENKDEISLEALESSQGSPPPPRVRTDWIVRATTDEEKQHYSEKEHERYQNPHKAFTFRMHSYEAIVGPVKGVYSKDSAMNKAREHSLLIPDRPSFVTILSLVRDAAARLPNGEGTRADICELLKDSQYLAPATDAQINTVVSGALDRLHYEKDPCVKYDVCRKLWIYLHRNRTEEEFERIHQAQGAAAKAKKAIQKAKTSKLPKTKEPGKDPVKDLRPSSSLSNASTDSNLSIATTSSAAATTKTTHTSPKMVTAKIARSTSMPQAVQDSFVHPQQASPKQVGTIVSHVQSSAKALATNLNQIQQSSPVHVPEATTSPLATLKGNLITSRSPSTGQSQSSHFIKTTTMKPGVWTSVDSQINTSPQINPKLASPFMQSAQKPLQSVQKPMQSMQKLMQSAQKPIHSAQKPMQLAQKPLQLAQKPIQMTQKPMQFAQKSIQMAQKPMQLAQKPMQTAQKPMQTAQKPMQPGQKPMQSAQKPIQAGQFLPKSLPVIGQPQTVSVTATNIITSSGVKLVSAGPNQPQMVTTHQAPLVAKSVSSSSIPPGAQSHMHSLQTILIKQEQNSAVSKPGSPKPGGAASSKPVVARIISSPQVVNVSSLIANTIAAQQKQGSSVPGTTTIKIQGGNIIRSIGGKPTQMSVIHTPQGSTGIPTFTLVTQPSGGTVMPPNTIYTPAKIVTPTQMGVLASQTGLQSSGHMTVVSKSAMISTQSGLKIVSGAHPGMKISQLTATLPQNVMMAKPATSMSQAVTVVAATAKPGTTTVTLATPTSSPTIFTTQGLLKTPQTVVMATPVNTSTVVMAAQPCRSGTVGTNVTGAPAISVTQANTGQASSVSLKTVQGVKVIPVTQASTRGKSQPVFARIITPPTGLSVPLRPPNQGISVIQSIGRLQTPTIMSGQHATILQVTTPQSSDDSKSQADKDAS